jgi:hypothetical protein
MDNVRIFNMERLVPPAVLFKEFYYKPLVIRDCQFLYRKNRPLRTGALDAHNMVVGTQGINHPFLHGRAFGYLFIHYFHAYKVDVERHGGFIGE